MSQIMIIEKPETVSFDEIHEVLWKANEENRDNGFILATSNLSGEQLAARIGDKGKCFIALDGEKIVGTISVRFVNRNRWYYKGEIPDYMLAAVLPEYQGQGINSLLSEKVFEYVREKGYPCIELDTAENNKHAIEVYRHQGFDLAEFRAFPDVDHYSVVMVKWFNKRPYSNGKRTVMYNLKKTYTKLRYTTGKKKRLI